jgi:hypothetical protein
VLDRSPGVGGDGVLDRSPGVGGDGLLGRSPGLLCDGVLGRSRSRAHLYAGAPVGQLGLQVIRHKHVIALEITVQDPLPMQELEAP